MFFTVFVCFRRDKNKVHNEELEARKLKKAEDLDNKRKGEPSLYLISSENKVRKFLQAFVVSNRCEFIMLGVIFANSILLALDSPLSDPNSSQAYVMAKFDIAMTSIFLLEAVLKIVAFGLLFCGSTSYLRNGWNIADFTIAILSVISVTITSQNLHVIKVFRLLKVLRPIRVTSKMEGLKISIKSLSLAIPGILNVLIVMIIFFLIFGVIGINYFKGRLFYCDTDFISYSKFHTIDDKWDCLNVGGEWLGYFLSFDNIGVAMTTLFSISTQENWVDLMYQCAAIRGYDMNPVKLSNKAVPFYFVAFMVVANFFLLNLFVGEVISTYNRENEVKGKNFMLTDKQRKWLQNKIMLIHSKPIIKMKTPA